MRRCPAHRGWMRQRGTTAEGKDGAKVQEEMMSASRIVPHSHRPAIASELSHKEKRATGGDPEVAEGKDGASKVQEETMSASTEPDKGICSLWPQEGILKLLFEFWHRPARAM